MKAYLWCSKCKEYPIKIIERYEGNLEELRKWRGDCYELVESNISDLHFKNVCAKCNTELEEKEQK